MKRKQGLVNCQRGFTLVEVIAVLILLGILAAVAAPKFISLEDAARVKAASAGVAEAKATLSMAYGKAYLIKGSQPDIQDVVDESGLDITPAGKDNTFGDVVVNLTLDKGKKRVDIVGVSVGGNAIEDKKPPVDYWYLPDNT